jgi:hypothetical protein
MLTLICNDAAAITWSTSINEDIKKQKNDCFTRVVLNKLNDGCL